MKHLYFIALIAVTLVILLGCGGSGNPTSPTSHADTVFGNKVVVFGYNDLGMHCMNADFSEMAVLPPFNNLFAQVVQRGDDPKILKSGVTVKYSIPGNTHSADKSNFWTYLHKMGINTPNNIGLTGSGMSGNMTLAPGRSDWLAMGIPVIPFMDNGQANSYPLSLIQVFQGNAEVARTQAVVPVSTEMSCNICHTTPGMTVAKSILTSHDKLHKTKLVASSATKTVICGSCHRQPPLEPLGLHGNPSLPNLSRAMHSAHANRMAPANKATGGISCYACHPGILTKCQRDVHFSKGLTCMTCHGQMAAVASPSREPWSSEPRCSNCHSKTGSSYEQPNTLYRNSIGHMGIHCEACHGSPHAITPTVVAADNVQAIYLQGHSGTIDTCLVCHTQMPDDSFPHRVSGD